ncbi:hypothetical protein BDL97_12G105200 [Sphagnum fallax]|nr:hypothetical protein BDL97_12G105200 [Sphagnum fallax]
MQAPCNLLERLVLRDCIAVERLPENIGELSKLKVLDLRGCSTLKTLPSFIGALKALKDLDLACCFMLEALPNSIGNLSDLKTLSLNYCQNLKELPMTFGNLQNLVDLWAEGASFFRLPNSFSNLLNLEVLNLNYCMNLHDLPPSISGLVKLRELYMGKTKVEKLPEDIGQLESLKKLRLFGCKHLKTLPQSFGCLGQLEHLDMSENPSLEMPPESVAQLEVLNHFSLGGCSFGEGIGWPSNVGNLTNLKSLFLSGNLMTTIPESFKDLNALVNLQMLQCPNLVVVQTLPLNLEWLNIGNCPKLTNIPCLGNLNTLKYLILNDCPNLTHLQGLDFVQTLVEVNISGSKMLCIAFGLNHDRALQMCGLSGSQSSMMYDNNWWKKEPTLQVVSYYDNVFPQPFPNSIKQKFVIKQQSEDKLCLNATILNEEECVAIIFCFCAHELERRSPLSCDWGSYNEDLCFMEARIWKNGVEVNTCHLFTLRHDDPVDQIYLCTLRKDHQFVKSLQFGDQVHVYAQFGEAKWASIVVEEVAIIMVHGEDGHPTIVVNSTVLDNTMSKDLQRMLSKLMLKNNPTIDPMVQKFTTSLYCAYCDYCYKNITSPRWKCSICKDFDLCGNCYEVRSNNLHDINGHVNWHPMFLVHI